MGIGHSYTCKCKPEEQYLLLGIGMLDALGDVSAYNSALNGEYGESWQTFVANHPSGEFDGYRFLYRCSCCDYWEIDTKKDYTFYHKDYTLRGQKVMCIKTFRHVCPQCSATMHIADLEKETLICQKCKTPMKIGLNAILWD